MSRLKFAPTMEEQKLMRKVKKLTKQLEKAEAHIKAMEVYVTDLEANRRDLLEMIF